MHYRFDVNGLENILGRNIFNLLGYNGSNYTESFELDDKILHDKLPFVFIKKIKEKIINSNLNVYLSDNLHESFKFKLPSFIDTNKKPYKIKDTYENNFMIEANNFRKPVILKIDEKYYVYNQKTLIGTILNELKKKLFYDKRLKYNSKYLDENKDEQLDNFFAMTNNSNSEFELISENKKK